MAYTEAQLKEAARKALAAGDAAAAKRFIDAARSAAASSGQDMSMQDRIAAAKAGTLQMQPGSAERAASADAMAEARMQQGAPSAGLMEGIGSGAAALTSGLARGGAELVGLPGTVGDLMNIPLQKLGVMPENAEPSALSGAGLRKAMSDLTGGFTEYKSPYFGGQVAGTAGEFLGGGANPKAAISAALGSEVAGAATEGTPFEPYARFAGAFFAPIATNFGNKTVNTMFKRSSERPSVESLKTAKTAAYKAVDASGLKADAMVPDTILAKAKAAAAAANYVPDVDNQTRAALVMLENQRGKSLKIGELDKLRQGLWSRYNAAPNEKAIGDMIDIVDEAIDNLPGGEIMDAARIANSRFKKAELLDNAFTKAADATAATGSGGNILNKYRQAVTNIINNPKQSKFFSSEEIDFMRKFVRGDLPENTLRLMGKLSPSGNGLMMALNFGAIAQNPLMAAGTVLSAGAKSAADTLSKTRAEDIKTMLATGVIPTKQPSAVMDKRMIGLIPGLLAN